MGSLNWRGNGKHTKKNSWTACRVNDTRVRAQIKESLSSCKVVTETLSILGAALCTHAFMTAPLTWFLTADSRAAEASEGSRDQRKWPGHYSATTNNSPQDKESFVTGAALTNSMHCVIKLANTPLPLCDT